VKIIKISSCQECPFYRVDLRIGYNDNYCGKYAQFIKNPTRIQDWCELEDAKDGEDKDRVG